MDDEDNKLLRALLAGFAMAGDWAAQDQNVTGCFTSRTEGAILTDAARLYVRMADAVLDALKEPTKQEASHE